MKCLNYKVESREEKNYRPMALNKTSPTEFSNSTETKYLMLNQSTSKNKKKQMKMNERNNEKKIKRNKHKENENITRTTP